MTDDEGRWESLFGVLGSTGEDRPVSPLGILPGDLVDSLEPDEFVEPVYPLSSLPLELGVVVEAREPLPEVVVLAPVQCGYAGVDLDEPGVEEAAPEMLRFGLAASDELALIASLLRSQDEQIEDLDEVGEEGSDGAEVSWFDSFEDSSDDDELDPEVLRALGLEGGEFELDELDLDEEDSLLDEDIDRSGKADTQSHQARVELVAAAVVERARGLGWDGEVPDVRPMLEHVLWDSGNLKLRGNRVAELLASGRSADELERAFELRVCWDERFKPRGLPKSPAGAMSWSVALRILDRFEGLPDVEEIVLLCEDLLTDWVEDRARTRRWWGHEPYPGQGPHGADAMPVFMIEYLDDVMEQCAEREEHALAIGVRWEPEGVWSARPDQEFLAFGCRGISWRV
jgi:hypothetical protein